MLFDLHNDYPTEISQDLFIEDIGKCRSENAVVTAAIWTSEFGDNAYKLVSDITTSLENIGDNAYKLVSDITTSLENIGDKSLPVAIEDLGFLANGQAYKSFDFSKYLYCSLTWNNNNGFAGGALDNGELTEAGRDVIELMNVQGCIVDLAHLNRPSFYQALERSRYAICSHTGFNNHPRSLNDEQIRALTARNGVIGLCTVTKFTDAHDCKEFETLIDCFVQKYGIDYLAIGTDFNGSTDIPQDLCDYRAIAALSNGLRSRGYSDTDIDKILFTNANNIRREIL